MRPPKIDKLWFGMILLFLLLAVTSIPSGHAQNSEGQRIHIQDLFYATGYMGDGVHGTTYIDFNGAFATNPHSPPTGIRIKYTFGPLRYAGIYWQNRPDNWGEARGENYSKKGFRHISFWARGETGTEVVEFKAGDIKHKLRPYHDSFAASTGRVNLSRDWQRYIISLENKDLSCVIGGFCWVASKDYNNRDSITFYIDDIFLE